MLRYALSMPDILDPCWAHDPIDRTVFLLGPSNVALLFLFVESRTSILIHMSKQWLKELLLLLCPFW